MFFGPLAGLVGASLMEDFLNFQCYCFLISEMTHTIKKCPFTFYVLVRGNAVCCMFYLGPGDNENGELTLGFSLNGMSYPTAHLSHPPSVLRGSRFPWEMKPWGGSSLSMAEHQISWHRGLAGKRVNFFAVRL